MSLLSKVRAMFGFAKDNSASRETDAISVDVSVALQRNEIASNNAREAIHNAFKSDKMRQAVKGIVGKM